jgi:sulfur-oxidizing protein SoxY
MMSMKRRHFLKNALASSAIVATAGLMPRLVFAAEGAKAAPAGSDTKIYEDALKAISGGAEVTESAGIAIKVPDIAENGAVVPVQIESTLPKIESIAILVEKNPVPLIANFKFGENGVGYISTRIKMGGTSNVVALVKSEGKYFSAKKEVKVTVGGCGG